VWYAIRAEIPKKNAARQQATLNNLAKNLEGVRVSLNALHGVLETFPPELRVLLHEVDDPNGSIDWCHRDAWRSPMANVEAAIDGLFPLVEKSCELIPVRTGPKLNYVEPLKELLTAWHKATGTSAFTANSKSDKSQMYQFLLFAGEVVGRLSKAGYRIRKPTKGQAENASKRLRRR
jgi:hypothetical protein